MAKENIKLSVAIAVFNEEKNLEECLASVAGFADEIVVVDGGSTDATVSIANKFKSRIIKTDNPAMFHINKQKALDACSCDWILQLDADERITPALKSEIAHAITTDSSDINGYFIPRRNYFWGHWMRKGGQYPDYVMRLVRRGSAHFPAKSVHEQIEVIGKPGYLNEPMDHISYRTKADYWRKADAYITLTAEQLARGHVPITFNTWFLYTIWKPLTTFFSLFFRHKGFVDGTYGFLFAYYSALHYPFAYHRYLEIQNRN
jgi:glycosyltransferase involved in cell wall biosynthesis